MTFWNVVVASFVASGAWALVGFVLMTIHEHLKRKRLRGQLADLAKRGTPATWGALPTEHWERHYGSCAVCRRAMMANGPGPELDQALCPIGRALMRPQ